MELALESLFYWQCHECFLNNSFLRNNCLVCNEQRDIEKSLPSALLKAVEAATMNASGYDEALCNIPENHRNSIPSDVIVECIERKANKKTISRFNSVATRNVVDYFYWNCGFCTMRNFYKVYTCKCCSQKVSQIYDLFSSKI